MLPAMKHSSSGASARQRTTSGAASAAMPSVNPKLTTLLPTALPSASAWLPVQIARALTASSGSDVPKATSNRPATKGEAPMRCASPDAPLTIESPPNASRIRPSTKKAKASSIAASPQVGLDDSMPDWRAEGAALDLGSTQRTSAQISIPGGRRPWMAAVFRRRQDADSENPCEPLKLAS